jgi:type IV secretion system protein VirD4
MRNYAGHRLAPWLAHVMVSRQETARPLLTPGEVMQLRRRRVVLISGVPPIRASKIRHYLDSNFLDRLLPARGCRPEPMPTDQSRVLTIGAACAPSRSGGPARPCAKPRA